MPRIDVHSVDDPRLAPYRELNQRNLTRQSGLFIAEGDKVTERLIASRYPVASLLAEAGWAERLGPQLPPETPIYVAERKLLEATIGFNFHRGVLGCGRRLPSPAVGDVTGQAAPQATILVCPDVHDPTNLGSIIRTAAAFGCAGLVLGRQCADPFSRRVLRVSMGAALHLPIVESRSLADDLQSLRRADFLLAATVIDPAVPPLADFQRPQKLALLLGSEGHGLAPQWQSLCDRRITIPMQLGIDSLNVAVAAAVFLYHFTRRSLTP
ncbi:MAG: RNA methyltransferase [Planctomycetaceae bacterium]|nr:RNA methyltransferase [Planctomycetaceae bacterium]